MPRLLAGAVVVALIAVLAACGQAATGAATEPSTAARTTTAPSHQLRLAPSDPAHPIADAGSFASDPSASLNSCRRTSDGSWRALYAGGDPWVAIDLLLGTGVAEGAPSEDLSLEIQIGSPLSTYLWIDQPGYRGGDAPGRSHAIVEAAASGIDAITFEIAADTPMRTVGSDLERVDVALTLVCPAP